MKYSYSWLRELSGTKLSAEKAAELLMLHAFEVEGLENKSQAFENVVVGEILEIKKHPNADKLQLTKINIGDKKLDIVCGAPNISVGDKVPVALVGAKLPNGIEIREAEIRGIKSFGMLCAKDELGLGTDHSGIFILERSAKIGISFAKAAGLDGTAIEIDVLANRAHDALSHVGMAREIAALSGKEMEYDYDGIKLPNKKTKKISVKIENNKIVSRYIGAVMENVQIKESPDWLKMRLEQCGIRAINNIVDVTNYVMLELGQPLHAFDFEKVSKEIIVRNAKNKEKITLLDETIKELSSEDIVIADKNGAIALAGIMGGFSSAINENTKTIILEAATFDAASIRKTRMNRGIVTDAALRFEKDLDPNLAEKAMARAIEIIEHIADGKLDGIADAYPKKKNSWTIKLDLERATKLLGEKIPLAVSKKILTLLGFEVKTFGKQMIVTVPTFRLDVTTQEDLIEEIGRMYGYEKIRSTAPLAYVQAPRQNEKRLFSRELKNILATLGFSEEYNYSFYSERDANFAKLGSIKHLELENPMNPDQALLRVSLMPNILKNIKENIKNHKELHIFEIGHVYEPNSREVLPEEKEMLVGAVVLEKKSEKEEKQDKRNVTGFYEAKGYVDEILSKLGITDHYYDNFNEKSSGTPLALWHKSRSAEIKIEGSQTPIGFVGEINPTILTNFGINTRVAIFEFDVESLQNISAAEREFLPIRKYPTVMRDISMVVSKTVRVDDILKTIQRVGGNLVLDVDLFDIFDYADDTSSFAFHIILGADEKTLTGKEIDDVMNSIVLKLEKEISVKVRK